MRSGQTRTVPVPTAATRRGDGATAPPARASPRDDGSRGPLVLDRYRLHRRLGAGGFGTVWLARDERLERDVAVKLLARDRIIGGRFEREARAAARLSHPGIVTLYEAAVDDEGAYLVSELVRGATLDALLTAGQLSDRDIVAIGLALCDALDHAHAQGVVHRDVKPSNVLVPEAPANPSQVAKLTDFGVARLIDSDALTATGDVLGTLAYMAPEQAEGLEADARADLYSLALVLYEALTGVNPVATAGVQRARRLGAHLPPLRRQRRDLPAELGHAIDTAVRPRPRERGSLAELRAGLSTAHHEVGDEPGIVTGAWTRDRAADNDEPEPFARREDNRVVDGDVQPDLGLHFVWPARALAAAAAAGFAAWTCARLGSTAALPTPLVALIAGAAVLALPRLGWLMITTALAATAVLHHHPGGALVLAVAALAPIALLPRRPTAWPLAAAAPALGLIGLAGAWPALAARAGNPWRRAALGALGWVWLLAAAAATGRHLYLPAIPGVPSSANWLGSLHGATHRLLPTVIHTGVLAAGAAWAVAAVLAPWMVRGRILVLDVVRALAWAGLTVAGVALAIAAVHGGADPVGTPPTAVAGALAAAALALWPLGAAAVLARMPDRLLRQRRSDPERPGLP